jgi:dUTP pyrophosphatase
MNSGPLSREEIARLIGSGNPLIQDFLSLESQLQPNGFDLSLLEVAKFEGRGQLGALDADRELPCRVQLEFDHQGWVELQRGAYLVTFNEVVNLPQDLMALGRPRSSLLRSGVSLHTAVWDAGYRGRSQSLLTVHHPAGFRLQRNARMVQLVFFRLAIPPEEGYRGRYMGEGI